MGKIQLVNPNAGGAAGVSAPSTGTNTKSTATNNIFSAIRRRLVDDMEEEERVHSVAENNMVSDHEQKCKVLKGYEVCIGHDFVEIRTPKSSNQDQNSMEMEHFENLVMNEFYGNEGEIRYIASQQF